MVQFDTSYVMPRCKYRYYVTLLPCNQFHYGGGGDTALAGGRAPPGHPLEPPIVVLVVAACYLGHL